MRVGLWLLAVLPLASGLKVVASKPATLRAGMSCMTSVPSRREALVAAGAMIASTLGPRQAWSITPSEPDYNAVADSLRSLITADPDIGPTMLRLAWHSSGTYDKISKTGGSQGGTIRFKEELAHGGNAGLDKMVVKLEPLKQRYPEVSYADLYTLAGKVAIEAAGGPHITWRAGRVDELSPEAVTPDGRLPDADKHNGHEANAKHLRMDVFYRMGFNDREIVCLSGAHALGRAHADASGYSGPWTPTPTTLNNAFFALLVNTEWTLKQWDGPEQYEDPSGKLMMLPSDIVLIKDPKFRKHVVTYAKDNELFRSDFAKAVGKLFELGTHDLHAVAIGGASAVATTKASASPFAPLLANNIFGVGMGATLAVAAVAAADVQRTAADADDEACIVYEGAEVCGPARFNQGAEDETCVYNGQGWVCA
jgi:cytochrome c peroxidase